MRSFIQINDLWYSYFGARFPSIKRITIDIEKGEKVLVLGRSGSGKSTFLLCLSGLIPHSYSEGTMKGKIYIGNEDLSKVPPYFLKNKVGIIQQNPSNQLFERSVENEIAFGPQNVGLSVEKIQERVSFALNAVEIEKYADQDPFKLSLGLQQRVCMAAMLALNPSILIFDEPTCFLDEKSTKNFIRILKKLNEDQNITIIASEHRTKRINSMFERILVLNKGSIALDDTYSILKNAQLCSEYGIQPIESEFYPVKENFLSNNRNEKVIEVKNISFSYNGQRILKNISFTVNKGESIGILGENGSGKTTLILLLAGILRPLSGTIRINGKLPSNLKRKELAREIGVLLQNPDENILTPIVWTEISSSVQINNLPPQEKEMKIKDILNQVSLSGFEHKKIFKISYGERERVALGSLLASNPEIIILDEPTVGLDYENKVQLIKLIKNLLQEHTLLAISHDFEFLKAISNKFLVLKNGVIYEDNNTWMVNYGK